MLWCFVTLFCFVFFVLFLSVLLCAFYFVLYFYFCFALLFVFVLFIDLFVFVFFLLLVPEVCTTFTQTNKCCFYTDDKTWNVINVLNVLIILVTQPKMYESNKPFTRCKCNPVLIFFFLFCFVVQNYQTTFKK